MTDNKDKVLPEVWSTFDWYLRASVTRYENATILENGMIKIEGCSFLFYPHCIFTTKQAAVDAAEKERNKRITSLRRQIEKLEAMNF